jgi:hypothetical protein
MAKYSKDKKDQIEFVFGKDNYLILGVALLVIIIGFALLSGGGSESPTEYSPEIFNARRLYLAPTVLLVGYGLVIYAILKKPKKTKEVLKDS